MSLIHRTRSVRRASGLVQTAFEEAEPSCLHVAMAGRTCHENLRCSLRDITRKNPRLIITLLFDARIEDLSSIFTRRIRVCYTCVRSAKPPFWTNRAY